MVAYTFKGRFVAPIAVGLGIPIPSKRNYKIAAGLPITPKLQTFRAFGKRRHARPGETLQLYFAMRSPDCFLIGTAICTEVRRAIIWRDVMAIMVDGKLLSSRQIVRFAHADGFATVQDMATFFNHEHRRRPEKLQGLVIKWRPIDAS